MKINVNKTKLNLLLILGVLFLILLMTTAGKADITPILPLVEEEDSYSPASYTDDWDYYTLPPGTDHYGDVRYWGESATSSSVRYTDTTSAGFSNIGIGLNRGSEPAANLVRNDSRASAHPFFDPEAYPRAVRIETTMDATFSKSELNPINLHNDYAITFFSDGMTEYWGYINTSDPFFLDIKVFRDDILGLVVFENAEPSTGYFFGDPEPEMTFPIFPRTDGLQRFRILTNDSTLVTLTPHIWIYPTYIPAVEENSIFSGVFEQGLPYQKDPTTEELVKQENFLFSIRMFNLSMEAGKYYRINTVFNMDEVKPGVDSNIPYMKLMGGGIIEVSGSLAGEGLIVFSKVEQGVTLFMYSLGEAHGEYSLFYQEIPATLLSTIKSLSLNVDVSLEYDIYYTFTLSQPSVIRVNYTSAFQFDFFEEGVEPGFWVLKTDESFINTDWHYIPAGTYAILAQNIPTADDLIRFNVVPVRTPGSDSSYSISEEGPTYAFELSTEKNRISYLNITTDDQINQSITYSYALFGKYEEFYGYSTGVFTIGNEEVNGEWIANPINKTVLDEFFPTRNHDVPILVVTPTSAVNLTDPITEFTGSFSISAEPIPNQNLLKSFSESYNSFSGTFFEGYFIPKSAISSTTTYEINDDITTDDDQIFGIPLNTDPNSIYNVTVFLTGNYSVASLNASFDHRSRYMGGNLRNLDIFGTWQRRSTNLYVLETALILTVSGTTYLYVDVEREGSLPYYNATLRVEFTKIPATKMQFSIYQGYNE
ncbi:MAG: hypothetical protein ACFFDI_13920, partial [Promethearchaeota archaeon]